LKNPAFITDVWTEELEKNILLGKAVLQTLRKQSPTVSMKKETNKKVLRAIFIEELVLYVAKKKLPQMSADFEKTKKDLQEIPLFLSPKLELPYENQEEIYKKIQDCILCAKGAGSISALEKTFNAFEQMLAPLKNFYMDFHNFLVATQNFSEVFRAMIKPSEEIQNSFGRVFSKLKTRNVDEKIVRLWYDMFSLVASYQSGFLHENIDAVLNQHGELRKLESYFGENKLLEFFMTFGIFQAMLEDTWIAWKDKEFEENEKKAFELLCARQQQFDPKKTDKTLQDSIEEWKNRLKNRDQAITKDLDTFRQYLVEIFPQNKRLLDIAKQLQDLANSHDSKEESEQFRTILARMKVWLNPNRSCLHLTNDRLQEIEKFILTNETIKKVVEKNIQKTNEKTVIKIKKDILEENVASLQKIIEDSKSSPFLLIEIMNGLQDFNRTLQQMMQNKNIGLASVEQIANTMTNNAKFYNLACKSTGNSIQFIPMFEKIVASDQFSMASQFVSQVCFLVSTSKEQKEKDVFKSILNRIGKVLEARIGNNQLEYYQLASDCYIHSKHSLAADFIFIKIARKYIDAVTWSSHNQLKDKENFKLAIDNFRTVTEHHENSEDVLIGLIFKGMEKSFISLKDVSSIIMRPPRLSQESLNRIFKKIMSNIDYDNLKNLEIAAELCLYAGDISNYCQLSKLLAEKYKNKTNESYIGMRRPIKVSFFERENRPFIKAELEDTKKIINGNIEKSIIWHENLIEHASLDLVKQAVADLCSFLSGAHQQGFKTKEEASKILGKIGSAFEQKDTPEDLFIAGDAYFPYFPEAYIRVLEKGLLKFNWDSISILNKLKLNEDSSIQEAVTAYLDEEKQKMLRVAKKYRGALSYLVKLYFCEHLPQRKKSRMFSEIYNLYKADGFKYLLPKPDGLESDLQWILLEDFYEKKQFSEESCKLYQEYVKNYRKQKTISDAMHVFFQPSLLEQKELDVLTESEDSSLIETNDTAEGAYEKENRYDGDSEISQRTRSKL
jgi:hypothetical protein